MIFLFNFELLCLYICIYIYINFFNLIICIFYLFFRLSEEHSSYSPATCLAKRWFCTQLLDDTHFPQILIELLMASLYVSPQPFNTSVTVLPVFLRFLTLISTTDWTVVPLIVNLNNLITSKI